MDIFKWNCAEIYIKDETFKDKMTALTIFATQQDPCFAMAQVPNFAEVIAEHLIDSNMQILRKDWEFFNKFTRDSKIIDQIFKRPKVTNALTEIFRSNNRFAHKKFYKFSTRIFANPDPSYLPLKKALCDIQNIAPRLFRGDSLSCEHSEGGRLCSCCP